mgnify:CR=1 FL=1
MGWKFQFCDTIFRQTILFCDCSRDIRHVGYSIFKYCSSFLKQIVHFIVYCEIRRRTNRTTSFHVEERQTFAICSQYRIHDSVIFRSGLHHKGSSTVTEKREADLPGVSLLLPRIFLGGASHVSRPGADRGSLSSGRGRVPLRGAHPLLRPGGAGTAGGDQGRQNRGAGAEGQAAGTVSVWRNCHEQAYPDRGGREKHRRYSQLQSVQGGL